MDLKLGMTENFTLCIFAFKIYLFDVFFILRCKICLNVFATYVCEIDLQYLLVAHNLFFFSSFVKFQWCFSRILTLFIMTSEYFWEVPWQYVINMAESKHVSFQSAKLGSS